MADRKIDSVAQDRALNRFGIPLCLHVPIGAVDEAAIRDYVGEIVQTLSGGRHRKAFLVQAYEPPMIQDDYPIWDHPGSAMFHRPLQVWVHVGYGAYVKAYRKAFPEHDSRVAVLSHATNRRMAAAMGFEFVRLTPVSRGANSSSAFSEDWGVTLHRTPDQMQANRSRGAFIRYADLTELMLMMDMKLGGGIMDAVNEGQKLIRTRPKSS